MPSRTRSQGGAPGWSGKSTPHETGALASSSMETYNHLIPTLRLTAGQALVRFLASQHSERDGRRERVVPAMAGIFGHGNVCGVGQALEEDAGRTMPYLQAKNE